MFRLVVMALLATSAGQLIVAQGTVMALKAGPTLGLQRWNDVQGNRPLVAWHAVGALESFEEDGNSALFLELGYHVKGRSVFFRSAVNPATGTEFPARTFQMRFNNASLVLGGKKKFLAGNQRAYYSLGLRGEYNIKADLEIYQGLAEGINRFVYGLNLGGGFEFPFSDLIEGLIDIRFSPDISRQIFTQAFRYNNPFTGREEIFREQSIKNVALELSFGIRFLRRVVYID